MDDLISFGAAASWTPVAEAYAAGDVIDAAQELALRDGWGRAPDGGRFLVKTVRFMVEHTSVISGETSYRAHLYNVTPPSALANNAAWDLSAGDRDAYLGYIDSGTPVDVGSTLYVQSTNTDFTFLIPPGGIVYAYLVTVGAFTPTAVARRLSISGYRV